MGVTAEAAAQAAAALKRAEDALARANSARDTEVANATQRAQEARDSESVLASSVAAEGQSMQERAGKETAACHSAHAGYGYSHLSQGYGYPYASRRYY